MSVTHIVRAMWKWQKDNFITEKCLLHCLFLHRCVSILYPDVKIQIKSCVAVSRSFNMVTSGHIILCIDGADVDPSLDVHMFPDVEYFTDLSFLRSSGYTADQKTFIITKKLKFDVIAQQGFDIVLDISEVKYLMDMASFVMKRVPESMQVPIALLLNDLKVCDV